MKPSPDPPRESIVPPLREDLQLLAGAPAADGSPTWVLVDQLRGKYFQIGWPAYQMLLRWKGRSAEAIMSAIHAETTCRVTAGDVDAFLQFLHNNHLMRDPPQGGYRAYLAQAEAAKPQWLTWLAHHYLFFQVPLVRPGRFLRATLPFVEWLFAPAVAWIIGLIGLIGIYLVSRQWDTFSATMLHFFTARGFALYVLCLVIVKIFHELGHAYTATRYGCRVSTMGVAAILLVPMLYSDTSDAWKLTSRRQRAAIGAAGMIVECAVAAIAIFAWSFLDDGVGRSLAFLMAATSLALGAAINLNPFMRFDGYYVLSDLLGIPNLHERAFAFGQWQIRRILFGLDTPMPEPVSAARRRFLVGFAWATWAYRFLLFLGIALVVYHFFFKLLGLILFAFEIGWFIVLPIMRELKAWWLLRDGGSRAATNMDLHRRGGCPDGCVLRPVVGSNYPPGCVGIDAPCHDLCTGSGQNRRADVSGRPSRGEGHRTHYSGVPGTGKRGGINAEADRSRTVERTAPVRGSTRIVKTSGHDRSAEGTALAARWSCATTADALARIADLRTSHRPCRGVACGTLD